MSRRININPTCVFFELRRIYFPRIWLTIRLHLFFFCSIDEWAYYDVPAMMDYVCNNTKYDKMYVVTYSLSSAILLATASARPEYNDKIIVSYHLAPFLAFTNIKSRLLRIGIQFGEFYLVSHFTWSPFFYHVSNSAVTH